MTPKERLIIVQGQLKIARAALKRFADGDATSWLEAEEAVEEIDRIEIMKFGIRADKQ